jgi:hypothetical protein
LGEVSGCDKAVAAVVALAAEDDSETVTWAVANGEASNGASGAFHELGDGHAFLDGAVVGGGHFGCGQDEERDHVCSDAGACPWEIKVAIGADSAVERVLVRFAEVLSWT